MSENITVGVIGTGIMGEPMVRNLLRAGFPVAVFNRTRVKAERVISEGAQWRESAAKVARDSDVILTVVTDSSAAMEVYSKGESLCAGLRKGALCIDMSTISPTVTGHIANEVSNKGGSFLDAPVSGGKTGAEAGTLSIMVGGEENDVRRAMPVFQAVGKNVVHCGPVGFGQKTKLCNQIVCGLNLLAVGEAVVFAKKVGLNPETMLRAISGGAAASWALSNLGPRMLSRDFAPMFMVDLQQKDLRIALELAAAERVSLPGAALVSQFLAANQAAGEGREGTQALVKILERLSNVGVV